MVSHTYSIDILVDGSSAGSFPFGSFFPSGTLTPGLSVGGIDPALEDIVMPGVTTEGFKGCIDNLRILGQLVDFSMSEKAEQVNFKLRNETQSIDAFRFDGEGYAQYGTYMSLRVHTWMSLCTLLVTVHVFRSWSI